MLAALLVGCGANSEASSAPAPDAAVRYRTVLETSFGPAAAAFGETVSPCLQSQWQRCLAKGRPMRTAARRLLGGLEDVDGLPTRLRAADTHLRTALRDLIRATDRQIALIEAGRPGTPTFGAITEAITGIDVAAIELEAKLPGLELTSFH